MNVDGFLLAILTAVGTSVIFLIRTSMNEGRREQRTEGELKALREAINGVGKKLNENQSAVDKRIRNLSVIVQFSAPEDKAKDTASLLKE